MPSKSTPAGISKRNPSKSWLDFRITAPPAVAKFPTDRPSHPSKYPTWLNEDNVFCNKFAARHFALCRQIVISVDCRRYRTIVTRLGNTLGRS
jgi:hypothetical protein